jgi:methyltransferase (TIGR00027 family)
MERASRSRTAEGAAFLRALHRRVDAEPWVFVDDAVEALLPAPARHFLRRLDTIDRAWITTFRSRRGALDTMRAQIVVRNRYAEDALCACRPSQYLVLAAGLDTFALRHARGDVQVFEVDHPATQAWKRAQLTSPPEHLSFVPVDFERTTLAEALTATEFDAEQPTFVSWLGTTYYLSRDAIGETLRGVRERTAPGTRLVLDYWSEAPWRDGRAAALLAGTRIATAFQSEPIRSLFAPADMESLARETGWRIREHLAPVIQNARYLAHRSDGLAVPGFAYLIQLESD